MELRIDGQLQDGVFKHNRTISEPLLLFFRLLINDQPRAM